MTKLVGNIAGWAQQCATCHVAVQFRYAFVTDTDGLKVVARTYAYVAAGSSGLAIDDIERPEQPRLDQTFNAGGKISDARDVKLGMTNVSLFPYVADGKNGLQSGGTLRAGQRAGQPGLQSEAEPAARRPLRGGKRGWDFGSYRRDRAVDESGNQIAVFGRRGARPFNLEEQQRMFLRAGQLWTVTNDPPGPAR